MTLAIGSIEAPTAWADRGMLSTVLRNLLTNAVKFTPTGGRVVLCTEVRVDEPGMVVVAVADNGIGMPASEVSTLFDRRMIVSRRGTGGERGLGLGLSICRELSGLMGGRIWLESTEGCGTTVRFTLPLPEAPEGREQAP